MTRPRPVPVGVNPSYDIRRACHAIGDIAQAIHGIPGEQTSAYAGQLDAIVAGLGFTADRVGHLEEWRRDHIAAAHERARWCCDIYGEYDPGLAREHDAAEYAEHER